MPDLAGRTLKKRYRIDALLGRGGMAEVYRAFDTRRHYPVAVKVLREDLAEDWEFVRRFQAEADSLARLSHQNIVRFYSFEQDGRIAFIVMDLIEGESLRTRLFKAQDHPMAPAEALPILSQIAAALEYAHAEGFVHRDVKPANILLQPDGVALLSDFGIAKAVDSATVTTAAPGTPAYMSPEQCRGDRLDARSDVYSLGVVLYEMLAGRRPFAGQTAPDTVTGGTAERVRWEQIHGTPPNPRQFNPALTDGIAQVILQALAKDPAARYASAIALAQAFEAVCGPRAAAPPPQPRLPRAVPNQAAPSQPGPTAHRPVGRLALAAAGLLALAGCVLATALLLGNAGVGRRLLLAVGTEPTAAPAATTIAAQQSTPAPTVLLVAAQPSPATPSHTPTSTPTPTVTATGTSTPTATASSTPLPKRSPTVTALPEFGWDTTAPEEAFVDGPQDGATLSEPMAVAGWSVDQGSGIARIEIYLDGVFQDEADYGIWRPDLASYSGFAWMLDPRRFEDGSHSLTVRYVDQANNFADVERTLSFADAEAQPPVSSPKLVVDKTVNVRSGPGTQYPPVGQLTGGTYAIVGRTKTADWWQIETKHASGWVSAAVVRAVDGSTAPIVQDIPTPPIPIDTPTVSATDRTGGGRIIYNGPNGIAAMSPDGSPAAVPLGFDLEGEELVLSPDGTRVAFMNTGRPQNIYVANADGSDPRRVSNNPIIDRSPAWSPDGRWLTYIANRDASWWTINVVDVYGDNTRTLYSEYALSYEPFWSPDGQRVGFASMNNVDYQVGIYVVDVGSGSVTRLIPDVGLAHFLSWSPDGNRIVYSSAVSNPNSEVYLINADGSNPHRLVRDGLFQGTNAPVWSPNGQYIAFGAFEASGWNLYLIDVNGNDLIRLGGGSPKMWMR